jgi:CheY-like chemotaxis protein
MPRRALIVDDNAANRELLAIMLQRLGYSGVGVSEAQSAREMMERELFDVVFLDLKLANGCGLDLAHEVRSRRGEKRPWLVAVSGISPEEGAGLIRPDGFDAFLPKPFSVEDLSRVIESLPARA